MKSTEMQTNHVNPYLAIKSKLSDLQAYWTFMHWTRYATQ